MRVQVRDGQALWSRHGDGHYHQSVIRQPDTPAISQGETNVAWRNPGNGEVISETEITKGTRGNIIGKRSHNLSLVSEAKISRFKRGLRGVTKVKRVSQKKSLKGLDSANEVREWDYTNSDSLKSQSSQVGLTSREITDREDLAFDRYHGVFSKQETNEEEQITLPTRKKDMKSYLGNFEGKVESHLIDHSDFDLQQFRFYEKLGFRKRYIRAMFPYSQIPVQKYVSYESTYRKYGHFRVPIITTDTPYIPTRPQFTAANNAKGNKQGKYPPNGDNNLQNKVGVRLDPLHTPSHSRSSREARAAKGRLAGGHEQQLGSYGGGCEDKENSRRDRGEKRKEGLGGRRVHVVETVLTVQVKDINDNPPVFPNATMFGEVQENGPIGE